MKKINYKEKYLLDPCLTPDVKLLLKKVNAGKGIETLPINSARLSLIDLQNATKVDMSGIKTSLKVIEGITCSIVEPINVQPNAPIMMFIHGGGWVIGSPQDHSKLVRDLVLQSGHIAVVPNYSRSPEVKCPVALNQCISVAKWIKKFGRQLKGNPNMLCIVGNSAGGNMTIGVSAALGKDVTCSVAMWPVCNKPNSTSSWNEFGLKRYLTDSAMLWFWDNYISDKNDYNNPQVCPLIGTKSYFANMPPILIQVAENDILRDEGELMGEKLSNFGCNVITLRYRGMIHDWGLFNALAETPEHQTLITSSAGFMNFHCMLNNKYMCK